MTEREPEIMQAKRVLARARQEREAARLAVYRIFAEVVGHIALGAASVYGVGAVAQWLCLHLHWK